MFGNLSKYTFNVTLPSSTSNDVIEWFKFMRNNNKLADALVGLVYDSINADARIKNSPNSTYNNMEKQSVPKPEVNQGDLFENLYNWQDSNSTLFLEDKKVVNKEKKKMLCV